MSDDDLGKLFRSLPDEAPPEGGLAALMAAATAQAREMAPPRVSLFARFVELFKRPPVLAFATLVVLIGGAVIVKRHGDELEVTARAVESTPPTLTRTPTPTPTPDPGVTTEATIQPPVEAPMKPSIPRVVTPKARQVAPTPVLAKEAAAAPDPVADATRQPPAPPRPAPAPPSSTQGSRGMTIASDELGAADGPEATAKAPPPASAEQLLHECQAAATRGDCASVRTIAGQIQTSNATFYRERVVKDAAIAKCLPAR